MTRPRSVSLPPESISMGKDSFLPPQFVRPWNATAVNGRFGTGNHKESLSSQKVFIRNTLSCMRFFSHSSGRLPTVQSAREEVQRFISALEKTTKVNFALFTSNNAIPELLFAR